MLFSPFLGSTKYPDLKPISEVRASYDVSEPEVLCGTMVLKCRCNQPLSGSKFVSSLPLPLAPGQMLLHVSSNRLHSSTSFQFCSPMHPSSSCHCPFCFVCSWSVSFLLRSDNEHASYICNSSGCQLVHVHAFWSVYFTCGFLFCEMIFGRHQLIAEACGSSVY